MTLFQESANIFCKGPSTSFWSCWSMKSLKRDYEGLWRLNSEVIVGKWPWTVQHLRGVAVFLAALFPEIEEGRIWLKGCCLTALKSNGSPIVVSKIETLERSGDGMWKPLIQGGSVGRGVPSARARTLASVLRSAHLCQPRREKSIPQQLPYRYTPGRSNTMIAFLVHRLASLFCSKLEKQRHNRLAPHEFRLPFFFFLHNLILKETKGENQPLS